MFFYGWWMIDCRLIFDWLMMDWGLRIDWLMHIRCNHYVVPCIHLQIYIVNFVQFMEIIKKKYIYIYWLLIDWCLIDDWLLIDWWLTDDWLIIDWCLNDWWLNNDLFMYDLWLIDRLIEFLELPRGSMVTNTSNLYQHIGTVC